MAVRLRDYQESVINQTREAMRRRVRRVLIQSPTGAGKTALATFMVDETTSKGEKVFFNCHRAELVDQTSKTLKKFGVPHGLVAAGNPMDLSRLAQVCSIDTVKNRLALLPQPRLAIWDECHHMAAAGWRAVMEAWPKSFHVGLSATPWRLDGTGLGDFFDEMVLGPSVAWLIEQGHLSPYRIFAPPPPADLKARGGDDGRGQQAKALNKPKLVGDMVAHWMRHARGMKTVGFACNVEHSHDCVAAFNAAGIPAAHLDGNTPKAERAKIIRDFAAGRITVLWNVSLFGEGFDLAAIAQTDVTIDCVILARQTLSLSLYLQMVGRALRPAPGKVAILLDHAGNFRLHGFPDDEREWTLEGREKSGSGPRQQDGPPPPVECGSCFMGIRRPLPPCCPHCGAPIIQRVREIEVVDGDLEELTAEDRKRERQRRAFEESECKSLSELVALGQRRGYPSPHHWAFKRWSARQAKRQAQNAEKFTSVNAASGL